MRIYFCLLVLLLPAACASDGWHGSVQCAPWAREHSEIALKGNAATWWGQARGVYGRSHQPRRGAVIVFRATHRLPEGHVSVVREVKGSRLILVDQANWRPGRVDYRVPVMDVSRRNDWSTVRVWWAPIRQMGRTTYPVSGFILPVGGDGEIS
jgi:surface antigen